MTLAPPENKGMTILDRDAFKTTITTLAISVPAHLVHSVTKQHENLLLNQPRIPNVMPDTITNNSDNKLILLGLDIKEDDVKPLGYEINTFHHTLTYDYWTTEQIISSVVPSDDETPSSFTMTGHIAHVNLKDDVLPFKHLIAQVILDKNKKITSVVNKTNSIDNTYRNFQMEVLAGNNDMIVNLKENECRFRFDFSKVYWNSRLQAEHRRLVRLFKKGDFVCDVMAGVGPFSVPAAKKGAIVYANDLNPESYRWLCENKKLNKISDDQLKCYNMDGRDFIRQAVKEATFDHFVMNLPATAIEFLDTFVGLYQEPTQLPTIHCHCFTRDDTADILKRVCQIMNAPIDPSSVNLHWVRTVAPKKDMYCLSFKLPPEIAYSK